MTPAELFLPRLERVHELSSGKAGERRWQFSCPGPNHVNGDKHPSAVATETSEGTLLFYCAASCTFYEIVEGCGLKPADAFMTVGSDRKVIAEGFNLTYKEALSTLYHEATVVTIAATEAAKGTLSDTDLNRLYKARHRIEQTYLNTGLKPR